jgi:hypothetical protein
VLPIPEAVTSALHRASAPVQVRAWLQRVNTEVLGGGDASEQIRRLTPILERAFAHGIEDKINLGTYAIFGLRYGAHYDDHPALQGVLTQFRARETTLIDAYAALGGSVWQEVQARARQRDGEAAAQTHQAMLREYGYVLLRAKVVNDSNDAKRELKLHLGGQNLGLVSPLGDLPAGGIDPAAVEVPAVRVSLPGAPATLNGYHRPAGKPATKPS